MVFVLLLTRTSVSFPTQKHFVPRNVTGFVENNTDDYNNYRFILIADHSLCSCGDSSFGDNGDCCGIISLNV
jgi:hypothetical protein